MNKINKSRHSRYLINLHIVWIPKDPRSVLEAHADDLKSYFTETAQAKKWEILSFEVMPDHVHLFVSVPPTVAPSNVVKAFKGESARKLLMKHPSLGVCKGRSTFWSPSYFVSSAGDVSSQTIQRYIEEQQSKG